MKVEEGPVSTSILVQWPEGPADALKWTPFELAFRRAGCVEWDDQLAVDSEVARINLRQT